MYLCLIPYHPSIVSNFHLAFIYISYKAWEMVLDIRTIFVFPSRKAFKVLINDKYEENLISTSFPKEILQDLVDQHYCGYVEEGFAF